MDGVVMGAGRSEEVKEWIRSRAGGGVECGRRFGGCASSSDPASSSDERESTSRRDVKNDLREMRDGATEVGEGGLVAVRREGGRLAVLAFGVVLVLPETATFLSDDERGVRGVIGSVGDPGACKSAI